MSGLSRGDFRMAMANIRTAKWRSVLTMLGVIIGIVAVVMVVGIGEGTKDEIAGQLNQFGKDLITVRPGNITAGNDHTLANTDLLFGLNSLSGLDESDIAVVQRSAHVSVAAPLGLVSGTVQTGNTQLQGALVLATNTALPTAINQSLSSGAFFGPSTPGYDVAVIGSNIAQSLFGEDAPLGQTFTLRGATFMVRGVLNQLQTTPLSPASDFNDAIFIPYQTAEQLTNGSVQMYSILAKPDKPADLKAAIASITNNLTIAHGGEKDFSVLNQQQNIAATSSVLSLMTITVAAMAAVSLVVGGIGIMNIMLASVTERTHEIGVRKAMGATNRQIVNQFMFESALLGIFGGVIGICVSLIGVLVLRLYTSLQPIVSWQAIVIATSASLLIGVVFGVVPAFRAAHKDPIEALRHE